MLQSSETYLCDRDLFGRGVWRDTLMSEKQRCDRYGHTLWRDRGSQCWDTKVLRLSMDNGNASLDAYVFRSFCVPFCLVTYTL